MKNPFCSVFFLGLLRGPCPVVFTLLLATGAAQGQVHQALDLRGAIKKALENNLNIKISKASAGEKQGSWTEARGTFDVNLALSYTQDVNDVPSASALDGVGSSGGLETKNTIMSSTLSKTFSWGTELEVPYSNTRAETNSTNAVAPVTYTPTLGIKIEQPLIRTFSGYFSSDLNQAYHSWQAALAKHKGKTTDIISETMELYFDALEAKQKLKIRQTSQKLAEETYNFVKRRQKLGKASRIDVMEAEAKHLQGVEAVLTAESDFLEKKEKLAVEVFSNLPEDFELSESPEDPAQPQVESVETLTQGALKIRPEMAESQNEVESAQLAKYKAQMDLWPKFTATYETSYQGLATDSQAAHDQVWKKEFNSWSVDLALQHSLLGYAADGSYSLKKLRLKQERLKKLQNQRNIELEIRKSKRQVEANWQRFVTLKQVVAAEGEKYKGQKLRHRHGKLSTFDLLSALKDKEKADLDFLNAKISFYKAKYQISKARGTLVKDLVE